MIKSFRNYIYSGVGKKIVLIKNSLYFISYKGYLKICQRLIDLKIKQEMEKIFYYTQKLLTYYIIFQHNCHPN